MSLPEIREMTSDQDIEIVRSLMRAYVQWLFDSFPEESEDIGAYYSPDRLQISLDELATEFVPPQGVAFIAWMDSLPVGCVMAHPLEPGIAEMKRLFVLPSARGKGLGRALITALIDRTGRLGLPTIRLDTASFLTDAIALYRSMGFIEIAPYADVPPASEQVALFFERRAQGADVTGPPAVQG